MTPQQQYEHDQRLQDIKYPQVIRIDGELPMTPEENWQLVHALRQSPQPLKF